MVRGTINHELSDEMQGLLKRNNGSIELRFITLFENRAEVSSRRHPELNEVTAKEQRNRCVGFYTQGFGLFEQPVSCRKAGDWNRASAFLVGKGHTYESVNSADAICEPSYGGIACMGIEELNGTKMIDDERDHLVVKILLICHT